jgi:hypothetical protein
MESTTNNLVKTITETIPEKISTFEEPAVDATVPDSTSIFSKIFMFFIIGSFLVFLGIIGFIYVKKGELSFEDYLKNKWSLFQQKMNISVERKKMDVKQTKDIVKEKVQEQKQKIVKENEQTCDNPKKENLIKALDNAAQTSNYMADDSSSNIQSVNKSKWCLVGEAKGVRNCVELDESQKCMSGDIFPSNEVCINPNLRF